MEEIEKVIEKRNSVELSISQKGKFSGRVKCYASTIHEAMRLATYQAKDMEELIQEKNKLEVR